jgi:hypothetical protein
MLKVYLTMNYSKTLIILQNWKTFVFFKSILILFSILLTITPCYGMLKASMDYEYEDQDINALLLLRAKEVALNLARTILIAPLENTGEQIKIQLNAELERNRDVGARTVLLPINSNNIHRIGLVIRLDEHNRVLQIQYIDPLGESTFEDDIPIEIRTALMVVYGRVDIESLLLLRQTDRTACGVLTIENLIRAAQGNFSTEIAHEELTRRIREHHLGLLERYKPDLQFNYRQENNISRWGKNKLLRLSLMAQFGDASCFSDSSLLCASMPDSSLLCTSMPANIQAIILELQQLTSTKASVPTDLGTLKFEEIYDVQSTKKGGVDLYSVSVGFLNKESKLPGWFGRPFRSFLLSRLHGMHDRTVITPFMLLTGRIVEVVPIKVDLCVLPDPLPLSVESLLLGKLDFTPSFEERLKNMHWLSTFGNKPIISCHRSSSHIREVGTVMPHDADFSNYNANFVYKRENLHVVVGEGPGDEEAFGRLLKDLLLLKEKMPGNEIVLTALGNVYSEEDFIDYYRNSHSYRNDSDTYDVVSVPISTLQTSNLSGYRLSVNGEHEVTVIHVRNMPDGSVAALDITDVDLLYDFAYSKRDALLFFHCKAGKGRSGAFAFAAKLLNEWELLFASQLEHKEMSIDEDSFIRQLERLYWELRSRRPIVPSLEQFKQAIQFVLQFKKRENGFL